MPTPIRTLLADPPWKFADRLPGPNRGAERNYKTMSIDDLERFVLPPLADDCRLFLWRVSAMVPEALRVVAAWGFVPKSEIIWIKRTVHGKLWFGMGRQVRLSHETCIIATRGRPEVLSRSVRSVFEAPWTRHSGKPDKFYGIVESLSPGPHAELFARQRRPGWLSFGDEL